MSPAGLEVERYIGSCLISAKTKVAAEDFAGGGMPLCGRGWTGMPLISMATTRPAAHRKPAHPPAKGARTAAARTPLSRLAIHTQGAPLILAGRFGGRKGGAGPRTNNQQGRAIKGGTESSARRLPKDVSAATNAASATGPSQQSSPGNITSSDSLSVASDESSGHSENSLPRIIKPRKRRKKDRKPAPQPAQTPESPTAIECSNIVTLKPYVPLCYELYEGNRRQEPLDGRRRVVWDGDRGRLRQKKPDERRGDVKHPPQPTTSAPPQQQQRPPPRRLSPAREKPPESEQSDDKSAFPFPAAPSLCQCRYCDPAGQIWDVDRHCYSPFLTPQPPESSRSSESFEESPFASIPLFLNAPADGDAAADSDDDFFSEDLPTSPFLLFGDDDCGGGSGNLLRRSWSGSSACSSASNHSGVDSKYLLGGDAARDISSEKPARTPPISFTCQGLEVSTEIVTSPNGHRDIEIRFYSSSPPSVASKDSEDKPRGANKDNGDNADSAENIWGRNLSAEDGAEEVTKFAEGVWPDSESADDQRAKLLGDEVNQLRIQVEE